MKPLALTGFVGIVGVTFGALFTDQSASAEEGDVVLTKEELGRLLFWDPILSGERDVACASCHHPNLAYADGRDVAIGAGGAGLGPARQREPGDRIPAMRRNSPTILNVALNGFDDDRGRRRARVTPSLLTVDQADAPMFWDSRLRSLEAQALEPIKTMEEMRGTAYSAEVAVDSVLMRLRSIPEYVQLFASTFATDQPIDSSQLAIAIAAFERTLITLNSPFDRFQAGDPTALTAQQQRGMETFDDAGCEDCHEGVLFSDFDLRTLGVKENPISTAPDEGAGRFRFRTPSLRNVALTAPYMHNGMLATLQDVVSFYDKGESENPFVATNRNRGQGIARVDGDFRGVDDLSEAEMSDIVAFLEALTDESFDRTIPSRVPSGLNPGGSIE